MTYAIYEGNLERLEKKSNLYNERIGFNGALCLEEATENSRNIITEQEVINRFIIIAKNENLKCKVLKRGGKLPPLILLDSCYWDSLCNLKESGFDIEEYYKDEEICLIQSLKINGTLYEVEKE